MSIWGSKKTYIWNEPDFSYAENYNPSGIESVFDPMSNDFLGYGKYNGANVLPTGLELLFNDRDITDTDYSIFDPKTQRWGSALEDLSAVRNSLSLPLQNTLTNQSDEELYQYLKDNDWIKDQYTYGDPYQRSLYYTPYEMALGYHTGYGGPMKSLGTAPSQNAGSIHPNVDYSFWDNATLGDFGKLISANQFTPQTNDAVSYWNNPTLSSPTTGFLSETNPWNSGYDYDYNQKAQTVKTGGIAGLLGGILSFIPGLQPVGMALSAVNAIKSGNPLGAALSVLPMIPGVNSAISSSLGNINDSIGSTLFDLGIDSNFGNLAASNILTGAIKPTLSSLAGGGDIGTSILSGLANSATNYTVAPTIQSSLQDMGLDEGFAKAASGIATNLGTNYALNYLSSLGDSDSYSESLSRQTSKVTPAATNSYAALDEGLASGFGLPGWLTQQSGTQQKTPLDTAKGKMTNNQLGGYEPEKSTQYLVG